MPKLITVTLNTAIDHVIELDGFHMHDTMNAKSGSLFSSGKGVNVAHTINSLRVDHSLRVDVTATGFIADDFKNYFCNLAPPFIRSSFTEVAGNTRINTTISDKKSKLNKHIKTMGFEVEKNDIVEFVSRFKDLLSIGDLIVM